MSELQEALIRVQDASNKVITKYIADELPPDSKVLIELLNDFAHNLEHNLAPKSPIPLPIAGKKTPSVQILFDYVVPKGIIFSPHTSSFRKVFEGKVMEHLRENKGEDFHPVTSRGDQFFTVTLYCNPNRFKAGKVPPNTTIDLGEAFVMDNHLCMKFFGVFTTPIIEQDYFIARKLTQQNFDSLSMTPLLEYIRIRLVNFLSKV